MFSGRTTERVLNLSSHRISWWSFEFSTKKFLTSNSLFKTNVVRSFVHCCWRQLAVWEEDICTFRMDVNNSSTSVCVGVDRYNHTFDTEQGVVVAAMLWDGFAWRSFVIWCFSFDFFWFFARWYYTIFHSCWWCSVRFKEFKQMSQTLMLFARYCFDCPMDWTCSKY